MTQNIYLATRWLKTLYFTAFMPTIQKHTRSKDILGRREIGEHEEKREALDELSSVSFCWRLGFVECLRKSKRKWVCLLWWDLALLNWENNYNIQCQPCKRLAGPLFPVMCKYWSGLVCFGPVWKSCLPMSLITRTQSKTIFLCMRPFWHGNEQLINPVILEQACS